MAEKPRTAECVICGEMFTTVSKDGTCSRCIREAGLQLRVRMLEAVMQQRDAAIQRAETAEAVLATLRTVLHATARDWQHRIDNSDAEPECVYLAQLFTDELEAL